MLPSERPYLCRMGIHLSQPRQTASGAVVETCLRCDQVRAITSEGAARGTYVPAFRTALELAADPVVRLEQLQLEVRDLREHVRRLETLLWQRHPGAP